MTHVLSVRKWSYKKSSGTPMDAQEPYIKEDYFLMWTL